MSQTVKLDANRWKGETSLHYRVTRAADPDCERKQQTLHVRAAIELSKL